MKVLDWLHRSKKTVPDDVLETRVIAALRTVFDPEIPVNIYDLGLIYALDIDKDKGDVSIHMTLTAPGCPVAATFPDTVATAVEQVAGVHDVEVELVWDPPWSQDMMDEAARLELGMLGHVRLDFSSCRDRLSARHFPHGGCRRHTGCSIQHRWQLLCRSGLVHA